MLQISEKLKQARLSAKLSQDELAKKLGIKRSTYQYWEENPPSLAKLQKVIKVLNLPQDYFFPSEDKTLEQLVKDIQYKKDWTIEQVADSIDYSRPHFAKEMKANNPKIKARLLEEHKEILQNVSTPTEEKEDVNKKYVRLLEDQLDFLKQSVQTNLVSLGDNIIVNRATMRAAIDYQLMKDSKGDEKKREFLMEQINKLIHLQLTGGSKASNSSAAGN